MKNFRAIWLTVTTMMILLSSCGARKVDRERTIVENVDIKKEDKQEKVHVTDQSKEIQSDFEFSESFDFRLIPSKSDAKNTGCKNRVIYVEDKHGNKLKTTANPGDDLIFGSNYMLTQKLNIIEKQKDSITKINYKLEHEVESLKNKLHKKVDKKANYIYPITSIFLLAVVLWIIYRYVRFKSNIFKS